MVDYAWRILLLSAVFAVVTAGLLFLAVRILLVTPIKGVLAQMTRYAAAPDDARRFINAVRHVARTARGGGIARRPAAAADPALKQRERLAQLGAGVA